MNCRDTERQIFAERDGLLEPSQQAVLVEHVSHCPACRQTRQRLTAVFESWQIATKGAAVPDPDREWQTLRRVIRGGATLSQRASQRRRPLLPWLVVPLGAAAAIAIALFVASPSPAPPNVARADAVEVSAGDGSVVFVDDKSGWVVVWEGEAGATSI